MKENTSTKLKAVLMEALQQFFEQSGVNQILLKLYQQANKQQVFTKTKPISTKVENILKNNNKAIKEVNTKRSTSPSGAIAKLRNERMNELKTSYTDEQQESTPMLNAIKESVNYTQDMDVPQISARQAMNEQMDPLTTGMSVLDSNMPDFLMRGLSKLVNK